MLEINQKIFERLMYNKYFSYIEREIYILLSVEINFGVNFGHLLVCCDI